MRRSRRLAITAKTLRHPQNRKYMAYLNAGIPSYTAKGNMQKSSGTRTCVFEIMHADNLCTKFALSAGFCFQLRLDETKMTDDGQTTHNP